MVDKNVVVYGRSVPSCTYCENLKKLLESKQIIYEYRDISDENVYNEFCSFRLKTVPAVFEDGVFIGGFTELSVLV